MIDATSSYSNQQGGSKKKKIALIVVALIVLALVGGILLSRQTERNEQTKTAVVEKKEPTPTEKPKIDKKSVKIQVLNGTGTPGQASTAVEALEKAGYNTDNIKTGNAENFDNKVTTVTARTGFEEIATDVKKALEGTFDEVAIDSSNLDEESEYDIVVVTGGKKFETPTPTGPSVSPTPSPTTATTTLTPSPTPTP
ncbi:LytR C-terminal domain-containing protein [Candidatus Roizmanbacteria bacterium]|nr:LytR C-terminal domain-containing protein [Candidatus Roizmanbacteria bacterium]